MNLPELPKTKKKKEADFGLTFRKWLADNPRYFGVFELKRCESSLPFSSVKEHQILALTLANEDKGLTWKIADDSRGIKPFDYFRVKNIPAYVAIKYNQGFVLITIGDFIAEKKQSKRKSLTWIRAKEIAAMCCF